MIVSYYYMNGIIDLVEVWEDEDEAFDYAVKEMTELYKTKTFYRNGDEIYFIDGEIDDCVDILDEYFWVETNTFYHKKKKDKK